MSNRLPEEGDDWEWVTVDSDPQPALPRERLRRGGRALAVGGILVLLLAGTMISMTGGVTAQTSFTANDVSTTSPGGQISSVSVAPNGTVEYSGLESSPSSVNVVVEARKQGGSWETVSTKSLSASGLSGSVDYDFTRTDLLQATSLSPSDFPKPADGSSSSTTLEVRVQTTLVGAGPNGDDVTASSSDTFTVTVHNKQAGGNVGGNANTNAN